MNVSYYTTCYNRWLHLKVTLSENLKMLNKGDEIVVVNFSSKDEMDTEIREFKKYMDSGSLVYIKVDDQPYFDVAVAKNLAARLCSNEILFNLDADNWIEETTSDEVVTIFLTHPLREQLIFHEATDESRDGTYGRIATTSEIFKALGGYRERMLPVGWEDNGFLARASVAGLCLVEKEYTGKLPIQHDNHARECNTPKGNIVEENIIVKNIDEEFIKLHGSYQTHNFSTHRFTRNLDTTSYIIDGLGGIRNEN